MADASNRREFLQAGAAFASIAAIPRGLPEFIRTGANDRAVNMSHDGLVFPPREYAALMQRADTEPADTRSAGAWQGDVFQG